MWRPHAMQWMCCPFPGAAARLPCCPLRSRRVSRFSRFMSVRIESLDFAQEGARRVVLGIFTERFLREHLGLAHIALFTRQKRELPIRLRAGRTGNRLTVLTCLEHRH